MFWIFTKSGKSLLNPRQDIFTQNTKTCMARSSFLYVKASLMNYLLSGLCPRCATPPLFCSGRTPAQAPKTDPEGQPEHQVTSLSTSHSGKQKRLAVSILIRLREENCIPDKQSFRADATRQQDSCLRQSPSIVNKSLAHSSKPRSRKTSQLQTTHCFSEGMDSHLLGAERKLSRMA